MNSADSESITFEDVLEDVLDGLSSNEANHEIEEAMKLIQKKLKALKKNDKQRCSWTYEYIKSEKGLINNDFPNAKQIRFPRRPTSRDENKKTDYDNIFYSFRYSLKKMCGTPDYDLNIFVRYIETMNAKWRQHKLRVKRQEDNSKKNSYYFIDKSIVKLVDRYSNSEGIDRNKAVELLLTSSIKQKDLPKDRIIVDIKFKRELQDVKENNEDLQNTITDLQSKLETQIKQIEELTKKYDDLLSTHTNHTEELKEAETIDMKSTDEPKETEKLKDKVLNNNQPSE